MRRKSMSNISCRGENRENGERHYSEIQAKKFMELKEEHICEFRKTMSLKHNT